MTPIIRILNTIWIHDRRSGILFTSDTFSNELLPDRETTTIRRDSFGLPDVAAVRRKVGFVFQNPDNQIVFPVVHEDIEFGLKRREPDPKRRTLRAQEALERLGVGHLTERSVHTLSGGERQLVALAAVLATEPALLVFDEPTTQLDLRLRNRFEQHLAGLPQPAVVVSHDLALMQKMNRVLVIDQGRLAFDGAPPEALAWYQAHCA